MFDPMTGLLALAQTEKNQPPAFRAYIRIRCTLKAREIRTVPDPLPYDFTILPGRGIRVRTLDGASPALVGGSAQQVE